MINRIEDYPASPATVSSRPTVAGGQTPAVQGFRQIASPIEESIKKYPGAALASAFLIGVALAWWIKRM